MSIEGRMLHRPDRRDEYRLSLMKRLNIFLAVRQIKNTSSTSSVGTAFEAFILHISAQDAFKMTWAGLVLSDESPVPHIKASLQYLDKTDGVKQPAYTLKRIAHSLDSFGISFYLFYMIYCK